MKKFVLFAFLLFKANKTNSFVCFLGESTARQSCFWFYLIFIKDVYFCKAAAYRRVVALQNNLPLLKFFPTTLQIYKYSCHSIPWFVPFQPTFMEMSFKINVAVNYYARAISNQMGYNDKEYVLKSS